MKRIVLTFGLISGAILSAMLIITVPFHDELGFGRAEVIGYTSMVLAFLLIYFGVRSYRDTVAGGAVRFGRALGVGALIALVASACYVATWQVIYYNFAPDYIAKYQAHLLEEARADGATAGELATKKAELDEFAELYRKPLVNIAFTFVEPLPVALLIALVTAGVVSRRRREEGGDDSSVARVAT
ncbi:MAG TPA: DUF4199 domain-containing protein [Gemmatimonadaceae bacterium]|nr:DUF4199 domain-containing protein [Gemmatimonadaceae bacterium]